MILFDEYLPRVDSFIRFIHAIPDAPNVDIYSNNKLIYSNLAFGNVTNYINVPPDTYTLSLYKSGTNTNPIITETLTVSMGSVQTIAITYEDKKIAFFALDDTDTNIDTIQDKSFSYIRFVNLSPTAPPLSLRLPVGKVLFDESPYLEINSYYPLSPGIYNFVLTSSDGKLEKYINNVRLVPNLFATIYIVGLLSGRPRLGYILTKDGI